MDTIKKLYELIKDLISVTNLKKVGSVAWKCVKWIFKLLWKLVCVVFGWIIHIFGGLTTGDVDEILVGIKDANRDALEQTEKKYSELNDQIVQLRAELQTLREEVSDVHRMDTTDNAVIIEQTEAKKEDEE